MPGMVFTFQDCDAWHGLYVPRWRLMAWSLCSKMSIHGTVLCSKVATLDMSLFSKMAMPALSLCSKMATHDMIFKFKDGDAWHCLYVPRWRLMACSLWSKRATHDMVFMFQDGDT